MVSGLGLELFINSQQPENSPKKALIEYVFSYLFGTSLILTFFEIRDNAESPWRPATKEEIINNGDTYTQKGAVEIQPDAYAHQIHYQGFFDFYHTKHIRLNVPLLTQWLKEQTGLDMFVQFHRYPVGNTYRHRYVNKSFSEGGEFEFHSKLRLLSGQYVKFNDDFVRGQ